MRVFPVCAVAAYACLSPAVPVPYVSPCVHAHMRSAVMVTFKAGDVMEFDGRWWHATSYTTPVLNMFFTPGTPAPLHVCVWVCLLRIGVYTTSVGARPSAYIVCVPYQDGTRHSVILAFPLSFEPFYLCPAAARTR